MADYTSLDHSTSSSTDPQWLPRCCICNDPVPLETSKTDEYGRALHEECYVLKLGLKDKWYVLKLWLNPDFLSHGGTSAGPRQTGKQSATFARRRWQTPTRRQFQKARRACDVLIQQARRVSWHRWPWNPELAAVVTVLLLSCWFGYRDGRPASSLGMLGRQTSNAVEQKTQLPLPQAMPAKSSSTLLTVSGSQDQADTASSPQQPGSAENEVVHMGDDVTVRYFTTRAVPSGSGPKASRRYIGTDVTVRYFTPGVRVRN
ncbi:MAG: hypothetical protein ACYDDS_03320 [Candidatus Sulfotelmatobacter sp.]